jgi:hypothetical protein
MQANVLSEACRVHVDPKVPHGHVALPNDFFERTGIEEGAQVVLLCHGKRVRMETQESEDLGSCDVAISPALSLYIGVDTHDTVTVEESLKPVKGIPMAEETFPMILEQPAGRVAHLLPPKVANMESLTVGEVLDQLLAEAGRADASYLVVPPNPEGTGILRGEACPDPSLDVKEWDPTEDGGKVRVLGPGRDEEEIEDDP